MRRPEGEDTLPAGNPPFFSFWVQKVSVSSFIDGIIESHVLRLQRNRQDVLCMEPVGRGIQGSELLS